MKVIFSWIWHTNASVWIHNQYRAMWRMAACIGIGILAMSEIVCTLLYVRRHKNDVTLYRFFFTKSVWALAPIKLAYWDLEIGVSHQVAAQPWLRFFQSRAVESVCEALPFAIFHCFVLVCGQATSS